MFIRNTGINKHFITQFTAVRVQLYSINSKVLKPLNFHLVRYY